MKTCSTCKQSKDLSEFYVQNKHKDGRMYVCKECSIKHSKEYIKKNPEVNRAKAIRWQRKMKLENRCRICGKPQVVKQYCQFHREYQRKYDREQYEKRIRHNSEG